MSDHRIEDLVEDSLRLVFSSRLAVQDKRRLVAGLYVFQHMFDTSDTYGRVAAELEALNYDSDRDEDAAQSPPSWLESAASVMELADKSGDRQIIHHWLGILATEIDEGTLVDETISAGFDVFHKRPEAVTIRETAIRHDVHKMPRKGAYIRLPSWSGIARNYTKFDPSTIEQRNILRFLLDHKVDAERIIADYEKDKSRITRLSQSALFDLPALVEARSPFRLAAQSENDGKYVFAFEAGAPPADSGPADPDDARVYLVIEYWRSLNNLSMYIGIRSGLIERWQGRGLESHDTNMHFQRSYEHFVPDDILAADTDIGWAGWKYRMNQSAKVLARRIDAMLAFWPHSEKIAEFYRTPLRDRIDTEGFAKMAAQRIERIREFGFFANEVDMLFACACRSWERGVAPVEEIEQIRDWLLHIHPSAWTRSDRVEAMKRLTMQIAFPNEIEHLPYRRHDTPFPLD